MLMILIFLLAFLVVATIIYSSIALLQPQDDPLTGRLGEIQSSALASTSGPVSQRYFGGGFLNSSLYLVSRLGGESWIRETDRELAQAGIRNRNATALYLLGSILFMILTVGGMIYFQAGNDFGRQFGGIISSFII